MSEHRARGADDAMTRAVRLAERGPAGGPNPRVGCVLTDAAGTVIAEGWHQGAGTAHAEAAAIAAARASGTDLRGAHAYVTLEPCAHTGRTGPCAQALIDAGVTTVTYAVPDPNPVAAGGAEHLRAAGVRVRGPIDPDGAATALVREWLVAVRRGRPFVTLKLAASLDGRIAAVDGTSRWITSPEAREHAHRLRARVGAIAVGTGTVLADNPALTVRLGHADTTDAAVAAHEPWRVAVGHREVPATARMRGPRFVHVRSHDPAAVLAEMHAREVSHVLIEGGPGLVTAFLRARLVDEVYAYVAPVLLGAGKNAVEDLGVTTIDHAVRLQPRTIEQVGPDVVLVCDLSHEPAGSDRESEMFTGIVEELGHVVSLEDLGQDARIVVRGPVVTSDAALGDSIAVDGVCLTVTALGDGTFSADVMPETMTHTALGELVPGSAVNLERALRAGGRLGGHAVQGHVDGVGTIVARTPGERWDDVDVEVPPDLARYIARKGSITISGVSLTVTYADGNRFGVSLIPTTLEATTLGELAPGSRVNIEVDVMAKYVERLVSGTARAEDADPEDVALARTYVQLFTQEDS